LSKEERGCLAFFKIGKSEKADGIKGTHGKIEKRRREEGGGDGKKFVGGGRGKRFGGGGSRGEHTIGGEVGTKVLAR